MDIKTKNEINIRDPSVWDEPEKFLPSRFLGADGEARSSLFLPFQSGRRRCVGEELGKALVFLTLASILRWLN